MDFDAEAAPIGLKRPIWKSRASHAWLTLSIIFGLLLTGWYTRSPGTSFLKGANSSKYDELTPTAGRPALQHLLIPASNRSPDLCKLVITATALSYPVPHLLAWEETFDRPALLGGGSHLGKVSKTLEYLQSLGDYKEDDLVLMIDGYDIWFQLASPTLVQRYQDVRQSSQQRLERRFGRDTMAKIHETHLEGLMNDTIVFGAGKRCAPNQVHTIACYATPESPLPKDLYGANTDTEAGWNQYSSNRQVGLNSGYIMGPVRAMRRLFDRASTYIDTHEKAWETGAVESAREEVDDGTGGSWHFYYGSDQSVFDKIWGRQEYVREVLRQRFDPQISRVPGVDQLSDIFDDSGSPSSPPREKWNDEKRWVWQQQSMQKVDHPDPWSEVPHKLLAQYDFGITLDYFSDIGHQTVNSERDAAWLTYNDSVSLVKQVEQQTPRNRFDCPLPSSWLFATGRGASSTSKHLPLDLIETDHPLHTFRSATEMNESEDLVSPSGYWRETPLYTHICMERIPAIIHHNGDKTARARSWPHMSWLFEAVKPSIYGNAAERAPAYDFGKVRTDKGYPLSFDQLCPKKMIEDGHVFGVG